MSADQRNQYIVEFKPSADVESDAFSVRAWRVEGWDNDYAFYGHFDRFDEVTTLIPREVVKRVYMAYDDDGRHAGTGQEPTEEAQKRWESGKSR